MMLANQNIKLLKNALTARCGFFIDDAQSSEQLSIKIFLKTNEYVSKNTIMGLFGVVKYTQSLHPKVLHILEKYAR